MRILAILNAVFAVVVAYTSIMQVVDMYNNTMFSMRGFNMPMFIITLFLFMACAVVILILERGIAKYLYIFEFLLYFALTKFVSLPITQIIDKLLQLQ